MYKVGTMVLLLVLFLGTGSASAQPALCDADGDGDVDRDDIGLIVDARNTPASGTGDPRDANGDGSIDGLDARQCIVRCTLPNCTANSRPVADAGRDQTVFFGSTVTLDGSGSSDGDGDPLTFRWMLTLMPAGSTAALSDPTAVMPTFVVDVSGSYMAELVVNDGVTDSAPDTVTISTGNTPPVADAGPDQSITLGQGASGVIIPVTVTLDGSDSTDVDGDPLSFQWMLTMVPEGSAAMLSDPTAVMPTFVADLPGTYMAQLIVNDGLANSAPDTVIISTENIPPVADAGEDQVVIVGETVTLNGSGSTDVDGDSLTFQWALTTVPAGSVTTLSDPTAVMPTFVPDVAGMYVAQLIVDDGTVDSDPDTVTIGATERPVADAGLDQAVMPGETVFLDGSNSVGAVSFEWSLTTVPMGSMAMLSDPMAEMPNFVADLAGMYVAQLIVGNGTFDSAPDTVVVNVTTRPVADAGPNQAVMTGDMVTLDGRGSRDDDGDPLSFEWSFTMVPAGSSATLDDSTAVMPTFMADRGGMYVAQLIVSDGILESTPPDTVVITANTPPVAVAFGEDDDFTVGPGNLPFTIGLFGSSSFDADGDPLTFRWEVVSTPAGSQATLSDPAAADPTFEADAGGDYVFRLVVNDGSVDSAPAEVFITVEVVTFLGDLRPVPLDDPPTGPTRFCRFNDGFLGINVENQGNEATPSSTTTVEFFDASGAVISDFGGDLPTRALSPSESIDLGPIEVPSECFDPDCNFTITVDSSDDVLETNELNNMVRGLCPG